MKRLALLILVVSPMVMVGCGSGSSEPSEADLRKNLSGPPSLENMRKQMKGHEAQGKLNGQPSGPPTAPPAAGN